MRLDGDMGRNMGTTISATGHDMKRKKKHNVIDESSVNGVRGFVFERDKNSESRKTIDAQGEILRSILCKQ
ncbi:hypothetical protein E2C01_043377 [Portunus trituberculatus]|uniref:Uncharacterized protein n=1 Tax=Portunus trituberculatus TaxID=210409 RepID=A0A5B7FPB5_PORTR|nr:hypothetical protein [Portunus trituberculatus]